METCNRTIHTGSLQMFYIAFYCFFYDYERILFVSLFHHECLLKLLHGVLYPHMEEGAFPKNYFSEIVIL